MASVISGSVGYVLLAGGRRSASDVVDEVVVWT